MSVVVVLARALLNLLCFFPDAHRALELLEEYRKRLSGTDNQALRDALSKAIVAIRAKLFQALLGERQEREREGDGEEREGGAYF